MYTGFIHYKAQSCAKYAENYSFEFHIQYLKYLGNGCPLCPGGSARTAGGARQVAPAGRLCAPAPAHHSNSSNHHHQCIPQSSKPLTPDCSQDWKLCWLESCFNLPPTTHPLFLSQYSTNSLKWTVFSSRYNFFHIQVSSFAVSHLSQFVNQFADASPEVAGANS